MVSEQSTSGQNVAVIGGGIIGLCCALKLQLHGDKVTIFDKSGAGEGCSKGNAGHFATEQIFPLATPALVPQLPKMLLSPSSPVSIRFQDLPQTLGWMVRFLLKARKAPTQHATKALTKLNEHAMSSWFSLLESVGLRHLIVMQGSLLTFESDALFKAYGATLKGFDEQRVAYQLWGTKAIREQVPNLSHRVKHGVFFPDTGHTLNPYKICLELKMAFENLGGRFVCHQVDDVHAGDTLSVVSDSKTQSFDRVIVATGAESTKLVKRMTGKKIPLQAERGYHLMLPTLTGGLPFPVSSADRKFIMTPMEGGLRLAGTVEYAALQSPPNMKRSLMLKKLAKGLLSGVSESTEMGEQWMGNRPSLPDSLPVIDSLYDGKILFAFGHQHLGLTQAAVTADLIAQLRHQKKTALDLTPFRLSRFG
ncbi:NAD(P)/FAD-dependent oxidoreductase [Vibrio sp. 16]|uniref:NAD(P)/FAD-dependent oxidoreductase n=1 Tax=Vibrio sp. 16 TaxID=391586 RepID=UPI00018F2BD2|nr:FAD-dependent oxidoreductase [Vibrio sp. 16]EED28431.1 D-amino acid dehydrogenase, small subunit [Vibrio sp. 16]CAK4074471.1 D-amino acid dehydrogenase [Vibrio sp. 16]